MSLWDTAQTVLAAAAAALSDPPLRQYVAEGTPAWDTEECEQLTVNYQRIYTASSNLGQEPGRIKKYHQPVAQLAIEVVRCSSQPEEGGDPPSPETIENFSEPIINDAEELWCGIMNEIAAETLLPDDCTLQAVDDLIFIDPSGMAVGIRMVIRFQFGCTAPGS